MEFIVVFVTTSNTEEAEKISYHLVEKKLIACSNILSPILSIFNWKNELCKENEVLLILKSTKTNLEKIISEVKILHSYETPEIIAVPIIGGSEQYLQWIEDETK